MGSYSVWSYWETILAVFQSRPSYFCRIILHPNELGCSSDQCYLERILMYYLDLTGYGARKKRCYSVVDWFLTKYLPRHHISIEILHRGLRREESYGYCSVSGDIYRAREFLIEIDPKLDLELYTKTLIHELIHLRQWVHGVLKERRGKMIYKDVNCDDLDYWEQPHEIEAHSLEQMYYEDYLIQTGQST